MEITFIIVYLIISMFVGAVANLDVDRDAYYYAVFWPILSLQWFTRNLIQAIFSKDWYV